MYNEENELQGQDLEDPKCALIACFFTEEQSGHAMIAGKCKKYAET
jgi:hypothetical protein